MPVMGLSAQALLMDVWGFWVQAPSGLVLSLLAFLSTLPGANGESFGDSCHCSFFIQQSVFNASS